MNKEHAYKRHLTKDEIARASYNWTEPIKPGPVHSATADYLELDRSIWIGTTIDNDGYREDYITDKVLYELVEQLAEDLAAAETDKDRDRLLDRHLDVLDAWGKQFPAEPESRYLVQETGSLDGSIYTEVFETLEEARELAAKWEHINHRDKTGREVKVLYVEKTEKYYMAEDLEEDPFGWVNWFSADDVEDRPVLQITLAAARVNAGLTQKEAGALIGVTQLTIRNWELGNYKPTPERYPAIEEAYKIPIANIII